MPTPAPLLPLNKQLKYKLFPQKDKERDFWKNLQVNIDAYCDKWVHHQQKLERILDTFSPADITKVYNNYTSYAPLSGNHRSEFILNQKASIDFYCCLNFAQKDLKILSRYFKIPTRNNKINKTKVYLDVLEARKNGKLPALFLLRHAQQKGSAKIPFEFTGAKKMMGFEEAKIFIEKLVRHLNTTDKDGFEHVLRFSENIKGDFYFLLLKETSDTIFPALPDNTRVQQGKYILIRFLSDGHKLMIDTQNPKEAFKIKTYLARKSKTAIGYAKASAKYNPTKFFTAITSETNINKDIKLIDAGFRETKIGKFKLEIKEANRKNDIIHVINWLKNKGILTLKNFSEFENLVFSSKGINYTIVIYENSWGQLKLKIIDKNKPAKELAAFRKAFEGAYNIPFDATLIHENEIIDRISITRRILDNKTIRADMPEEVEDILLDLMVNSFINRPVENAKRRCTSCRHISWEKGDCRICGNETFFDGDFLDIEINEPYFYKYFLKSLATVKELKATRTFKQINSKKYTFIEVLDKEGNFLSVYFSRSNPPLPVLEHFSENGNPLLVVLMKYSDAISDDLDKKNFETCDFAQLVNNESTFIGKTIKNALESQMNKWRTKVIDKGWSSYNRLVKKGLSYNDQDFEKDTYNILHEIFLIGDRMGGKFTGVKAPDGVLSIQNYGNPRKRYCMAWDCKYSVSANGYQLNDKPDKHRHYLYKLTKLDKVIFFGGLSTYAIISQNMNMVMYKKFYDNVIYRSRYKGNVLFVSEKNLLRLYKVYKNNETLISSYQQIFYQKVFNLFKVIPITERTPYPFISEKRMITLFDNMQVAFAVIHKRFKFERKDFN